MTCTVGAWCAVGFQESALWVGVAKELGVEDKVWATLLAVAFLEKHMRDRELRDGLVEKAMEYVARFPDVNVQKLLIRARELIQ